MPRAAGTYIAPASSWSPAVVSSSATPIDWNALLTDLSNALTQSMSRDGTSPPTANLPMAAFKLTGLAPGTSSGDSLRFDQLFSQGLETDVASAATADIGIITSTLIRITGTTGITSFGINYNGPRFIRFAGIVTLTNSATLVLPFSANLTTAANDLMIVVPLGNPATGWQVVSYQPVRAGLGGLVTLSGAETLTNKTVTNPANTKQPLTDAATISWDANLGSVAQVTLAGNRTIAAPANLKIGTYILEINQDGTGTRLITWNAVFKWSGGLAPLLSTGVSKKDIASFYCDGTNMYGSLIADVR